VKDRFIRAMAREPDVALKSPQATTAAPGSLSPHPGEHPLDLPDVGRVGSGGPVEVGVHHDRGLTPDEHPEELGRPLLAEEVDRLVVLHG
jgi:hypothetical protein